jgi:DNA recombination protein RmuC
MDSPFLMIALIVTVPITAIIISIINSRGTKKNQEILSNEQKEAIAELSTKVEIMAQQLNLIQNTITNSATQVENSIINSVSHNIQSILMAQQNAFEMLNTQMNQLSTGNENKMEALRTTVESKLMNLQRENEDKLEKIRLTVEEKLHDTLEKRLGDSFKIVSERLEMVYQGLGEMKSLAAGVGDLKKVLSNVKTRGILGEVQLGNILEQFLTKEQYSENVAIRANSQDRVEFTINLPGKDQSQKQVMLPIDAKFPLANYQRLVEAHDKCDKDLILLEEKAIEAGIKKCAKTIAEKYIHPPITTDFALMFIPIEGLYAEILRNPGLVETVQRDYRVIITGPTTLSAIINSLQMGFRTLAIEKRSSDVWKVLDVVRKEFVKFADLLNKTKLKLDQASSTISDAENRSRLLKSRLDNFENKFNTNASQPNLINGVLPVAEEN